MAGSESPGPFVDRAGDLQERSGRASTLAVLFLRLSNPGWLNGSMAR
jgi:hypothetical protein